MLRTTAIALGLTALVSGAALADAPGDHGKLAKPGVSIAAVQMDTPATAAEKSQQVRVTVGEARGQGGGQ